MSVLAHSNDNLHISISDSDVKLPLTGFNSLYGLLLRNSPPLTAIVDAANVSNSFVRTEAV